MPIGICSSHGPNCSTPLACAHLEDVDSDRRIDEIDAAETADEWEANQDVD